MPQQPSRRLRRRYRPRQPPNGHCLRSLDRYPIKYTRRRQRMPHRQLQHMTQRDISGTRRGFHRPDHRPRHRPRRPIQKRLRPLPVRPRWQRRHRRHVQTVRHHTKTHLLRQLLLNSQIPLCGLYPVLDHPPDTPTRPVASRMMQINFIMTNHFVVKISHINSPVRTELHVHRPKPQITRGNKIRLFHRLRRRSLKDNMITVDPRGHRIADQQMIVPLRPPNTAVKIQRPANPR